MRDSIEQHEKDINEVKKNTCQSLLELEEEFLDVAEHASEIPIPWGHHNNPEWRDELLAANRRQKNYNGYCGWPGCWDKEPTNDYCNKHKTNDPELLKLPDVKPLFATLNLHVPPDATKGSVGALISHRFAQQSGMGSRRSSGVAES